MYTNTAQLFDAQRHCVAFLMPRPAQGKYAAMAVQEENFPARLRQDSRGQYPKKPMGKKQLMEIEI